MLAYIALGEHDRAEQRNADYTENEQRGEDRRRVQATEGDWAIDRD